ncbi:MAG: iron-containing alcohol dehydrogenase family protein [Thermodesulfobacteriota bacterium]
MFRNFKLVSNVIFGRGCFNQLEEILSKQHNSAACAHAYVVDDVFRNSDFSRRIPAKNNDLLLWVNVDDEPKTVYVDVLTQQVRERMKKEPGGLPASVVGIGGGSTMDLAKAVALMLTNPGSSADYQGWDLIKNPAVYHVAVPTLSGTGAEVSRTTVLTGPVKKLGINSDYTVFDQVVLDPELVAGVPAQQRFYTGMDCYVHCVESLTGTYLNAFSQAYGEKAMDLCREVFLDPGPDSNDKLMMASYFGGMSIAYSQVGICHALCYGLSYVLGVHHGIGNCIVFDRLEEYYPQGVREFREMMAKNAIALPRGLVAGVDGARLEKMIDIALTLVPLWENALGPDWKNIMTRDKIRSLYLQM